MKLTIDDFKSMLLGGSSCLEEHLEEFSRIDSIFGDGDHGVTMKKIGDRIKEAAAGDFSDTAEMFADLSREIMAVNGGSAGPLYGTIFEGFAEGLEGASAAGEEEIKAMFAHALESFSCISTAKVGDKTMMDTLIPACERARESGCALPELMEDIAAAGREGADFSKGCVAKFGRARFHKDATIGTMDAGAYSLSCLITGFANGLK